MGYSRSARRLVPVPLVSRNNSSTNVLIERWSSSRTCFIPERRSFDSNRCQSFVSTLSLLSTRVFAYFHGSLGRLVPDYFPAIFGPEENLPLDFELVAKKFEELTAQINADSDRSMSPLEVAHGFIDVANESMSRPIRALTEARGFETADHNLATFGGAGGQHACEIADKLGIQRVVIHKYSSILSAYGMALAEVVQEAQEPSSETLTEDSLPRLTEKFDILKKKVTDGLLIQGIKESSIQHEPYLNLRYHGTDTNFMILQPEDGDWLSALEREHLRELSFVFPRTRKVLVDDVRIRGVGKSAETSRDNDQLVEELKTLEFKLTFKGEDKVVSDSISTMPFIPDHVIDSGILLQWWPPAYKDLPPKHIESGHGHLWPSHHYRQHSNYRHCP